MIRKLQRGQFGRHSERLDPDQLQLGLEDLEQTAAAAEAAQEEVTARNGTPRAPRVRRRNLGALPAHLPRIETVVDIENKTCPCCGGALHVIGEDTSEMLDLVPAQLRVKVIRRPRYGCRACEEAVVQAPAPERPITGGMATEALLAHVLVAKYADFLPLYRQAQIFARQGIALDRSTLCDWVGRACWWLEPLWCLLRRHVMASTRIFADDTRLPVLDPGRGRTKTGCLWGYAIDDRPWGGETPPAVVYLYAEDRKGEHPAAHLAEFQGILQVDGYSGFKSLLTGRPPDQIKLAFCRVGGVVADPAPHRPGRADFPHPVPRARASLTARRTGGRSWGVGEGVARAWRGSAARTACYAVRAAGAISARGAPPGDGTTGSAWCCR